MKHAQLEFNWLDKPSDDVGVGKVSKQTKEVNLEAGEKGTLSDETFPPRKNPRYWIRETDGLPIAWPETGAVDAGEFGVTPDGPIVPDRDQIITLTEEVANAFVACLCELSRLEEAYGAELDPESELKPLGEEQRLKRRTQLLDSIVQGLRCYADSLGAYTRVFGEQAALALDAWARNATTRERSRSKEYLPSHPWHYLSCGDGANPIPVDEIPPAEVRMEEISRKLSKDAGNRKERLRQLLSDERASLEQDKLRYQEIVDCGAEALSHYDRTIAHSSDEMARAVALALKYNHVSFRLGRIGCIKSYLRDGEKRES